MWGSSRRQSEASCLLSWLDYRLVCVPAITFKQLIDVHRILTTHLCFAFLQALNPASTSWNSSANECTYMTTVIDGQQLLKESSLWSKHSHESGIHSVALVNEPCTVSQFVICNPQEMPVSSINTGSCCLSMDSYPPLAL